MIIIVDLSNEESKHVSYSGYIKRLNAFCVLLYAIVDRERRLPKSVSLSQSQWPAPQKLQINCFVIIHLRSMVDCMQLMT